MSLRSSFEYYLLEVYDLSTVNPIIFRVVLFGWILSFGVDGSPPLEPRSRFRFSKTFMLQLGVPMTCKSFNTTLKTYTLLYPHSFFGSVLLLSFFDCFFSSNSVFTFLPTLTVSRLYALRKQKAHSHSHTLKIRALAEISWRVSSLTHSTTTKTILIVDV